MVDKIVRKIYEQFGRDAALAVGGVICVALDKWDDEDTEKYGTIARETLFSWFEMTKDGLKEV